MALLSPWWTKKGTKKLSQPIEDRFCCSRYLNDCIKVPNMITLSASGATASLVIKNGTKKSSLPFEDRFWRLRCLNDCIPVPDIYKFCYYLHGSKKIRLKNISTILRWILMFMMSKQLYQSAWHNRIICKWCYCLPGGQKWN